MTRYAAIKATGSFLPDREISNETLKRELIELHKNPAIGDAIDKLELSSGIKRRWYAPDNWSCSDIAVPAALQALERAGRKPEEVDLVILGTDSPDYISPATSAILQDKIGAKNAGTFDVGCACASFPTVLAAGAGMIASNDSINCVLCVSAYNMRKLAHPYDPLRFLFGDGSGAAVLEPSDKPGFVTAAFKADGSYAPRMGIFAGGTVEPTTEESVKAGRVRCQAPGKYEPTMNEEFWPRMIRDLAKKGHFSLAEIDLVILTQVRIPTIETVMKTLELPLEKTHHITETAGYTGSACIPMALHDAILHGKGVPGSGALTVMVGSGVGYNLAGAVFRM